jgi:hypothetical protein
MPFLAGRPRSQYVSYLVAFIAAVGYGFLSRFVFGEIGGILSLSFFVLTPMALGFLTVALGPEPHEWSHECCAPVAPCSVWVILTALLRLEYGFCVLLAWPLFLALAGIGGTMAASLWGRFGGIRSRMMSVVPILALIPYLVAPVEAMFPAQEAVRRVHTQIDIAASPEVVWRNITSLRPIGPDEQRFAFFHLVGLPRPIEARMACEQIDCIRRGQWEDGLAFNGIITDIEQGKRYWVRLEADTSLVTSSIAPLAGVGGKTFGMVDDGYELEPLDNGSVRLHLSSTYRIRSGINAYAGLWLDVLMRDIQRYILAVEKARCEQEA